MNMVVGSKSQLKRAAKKAQRTGSVRSRKNYSFNKQAARRRVRVTKALLKLRLPQSLEDKQEVRDKSIRHRNKKIASVVARKKNLPQAVTKILQSYL